MKLRNKIEDFLGFKIINNNNIGLNPYRDISNIFGKSEIKTIFDVGANEGQTVAKLLKYFPGAQIYSFEPGKEAYQKLLNKYKSKVKAFNIGFGTEKSNLLLKRHVSSVTDSFLPDDPQNNVKITKDTRKMGVESCSIERIDDFCKDNLVKNIDLLKIDTQGFELNVVKGAGELLTPSKIKAVLLEVCFANLYIGQADIGEIVEFLTKRDYGVVDFYDKGRVDGKTIKWCDILFVSNII